MADKYDMTANVVMDAVPMPVAGLSMTPAPAHIGASTHVTTSCRAINGRARRLL